MNDERYLREWLLETATDAADSHTAADRLVVRSARTRQRHRWWPLWSGRTTAADPPRRTRLMLNPSAAITVVAVVAIGATLMLTQPSSPTTSVPAAEIFGAAPVEVSGRLQGRRGGCDSSTRINLDGFDRVQSELCFNTWQFTDDRFRGDVRRVTTEDVYTDGSGLVLHISTHVFTDDDGVWRERPEVRAEYAGATVPVLPTTRIFDGEGAYDGFLAVLEFRETEDGSGENDIHGFIVQSEAATAAP